MVKDARVAATSRYMRSALTFSGPYQPWPVRAYNTGAGNVSRAFRSDTNIRKAIPGIRKMTADELYAKLRKDLPYSETRDYIQKVRERTKLYAEWR